MNWKLLSSAVVLCIMGIFFIRDGFFPESAKDGKKIYTYLSARIRGIIIGPLLSITSIILLIKGCSSD
jgi:hypothetical protein